MFGANAQVCNTAQLILGRVHIALMGELRALLPQTCTSCGASCALGSTT